MPLKIEQNKITAARRAMGLSKSQMARMMGVHRNTLYKWETGERKPDAAAIRLVEVLAWTHDHAPDVWNKLFEKFGGE